VIKAIDDRLTANQLTAMFLTFIASGVCQGFGTHFYSETSSYEGEWHCGKRHGWGRMSYSDCSIYEGEWCDGKRCGQGMLRLRKSHAHTSLVADV